MAKKYEHSHEFTQYHLPGKNDVDVKIDSNFTNVLKNIKDQIGSLNANIKNFDESSTKLSKAMVLLTLILATVGVLQFITMCLITYYKN